MSTTNTIIEILKQSGYKNEGSNRERVIRNLNLLLDVKKIFSFNYISEFFN